MIEDSDFALAGPRRLRRYAASLSDLALIHGERVIKSIIRAMDKPHSGESSRRFSIVHLNKQEINRERNLSQYIYIYIF